MSQVRIIDTSCTTKALVKERKVVQSAYIYLGAHGILAFFWRKSITQM